MKEYTQEMRTKQESCPYCGFWHSAISHPPQFNNYVLEIYELENKLKKSNEMIEYLRYKTADLSFADDLTKKSMRQISKILYDQIVEFEKSNDNG